MRKIVFTGGGSGGHIMPLVAIIRELKNKSFELHYVGPYDAIARTLFMQENVTIHHITSGKIRSYLSLANLVDIFFNIPFSFVQSFFILTKVRPQLVFSKGGTGSVPVALAARLLSIPVFVHESDAIAGKSNALIARFAKKTFTSFQETKGINPSKTIIVGNPIRRSLLQGSIIQPFKKPLIVVWGGSQGAKSINDFITSILSDLLTEYEVAHIVGKKNYKDMIDTFHNKPPEGYYLYESVLEIELKNLLAAADIVVSRAGSGSIFEIAAFGKPSIIIPLSKDVSSHQLHNALLYGSTGAAQILEQETLTKDNFFNALAFCKEHTETMKQAALRFAKPNAVQKIAQEITDYVFQK